jgi:hypothetical protein
MKSLMIGTFSNLIRRLTLQKKGKGHFAEGLRKQTEVRAGVIVAV